MAERDVSRFIEDGEGLILIRDGKEHVFRNGKWEPPLEEEDENEETT